jgi:hypothetical protein
MSWDYHLVPRPAGAHFTPEALAAMGEWWEAHPTYRRSNGDIVFCRDAEYRDAVVRKGRGRMDEVDYSVEVIRLAPDRVTVGVMGRQEGIDTIYAFMLFCRSRWPCDVLDELDRAITAEDYRDQQRSLDRPRQIVD